MGTSRFNKATMTKQDGVLLRIVGEQLSAVVFVQDYLQLDFDGSRLTCNVWPLVRNSSGELVYGMPGYRDALCAFIGRIVSSVSEEAKWLRVSWDTDSLNFDLESAEVGIGDRVIFQTHNGDWAWW